MAPDELPCDEGGEAPCFAHLFEDEAAVDDEAGEADDLAQRSRSTSATTRSGSDQST